MVLYGVLSYTSFFGCFFFSFLFFWCIFNGSNKWFNNCWFKRGPSKKKFTLNTFSPSSFSKAPKYVIFFSDYGHSRTFIVTEPVKGRNVPAIIESAITRNPTGKAITFFFHHRTKILMVNSVHWNYRGGDNYEKWRHENSKSVLKTPQFLMAITLFSWKTYILSQGFSRFALEKKF